MLSWLILLVACAPSGPDAPTSPPARPEARGITDVAFAHRAHQGVYKLPGSVRPDGLPAPVTFHPVGHFQHAARRNKARVVRIALPIHDNLMPTRTHGTHSFGREPPPGLEVSLDGKPLTFERMGRGPGTWGFDRDHLYLGLPPDAPTPDAEQVTLSFARATERENALNFATAGLERAAFVGRTLTVGQTSHTGLLLPAPSEAVFSAVTVPADGRVSFEATVLPPAIVQDVSSDGARVRLVVTDGGVAHDLGTVAVQAGVWQTGRFDLSRFAGRTVQVTFRTEPGDTDILDYVFLEAPTLYAAKDDPERIVLMFVDTLRPDHLGMYGYERPTSPVLDGWAQHGARFASARSVAPWTLPSARAALSGRQPERWYEGPTLPQRLSAAGWHTEAFVSNAFLSQPFDMHRGWDRFGYTHLAPAAELAGAAMRVLDRHPDRDVALLVHLMEPHLPYMEGVRQRRRFAGAPPDALEALTRNWLVTQTPGSDGYAEVRQYVIDRYDQNIRAADSGLAALLRAAGPDATTVLFSDHGEEFWDHGGFEHGHAFHDELLRVPLVVRSPGLPAGTVDAPVSLLDIAPTVLELVGLPVERGAAGRSLVPVAWGDEGADRALRSRPQAFGRPLYGDDGWGVLSAGHKWYDRGGRQHLYALEADPLERVDLAPGRPDLARWPDALGTALDREIVLAWRVELTTTRWPFPVTVTVSHPDGVEQAWSAYDPRGRTLAGRPSVDDGAMVLEIPPMAPAPKVVYVVPAGDARAVDGLAVTMSGRQVDLAAEREPGVPVPPLGAVHPTLLEVKASGWGAAIDLGFVPVPDGVEVAGFHADVAQQLRELGYLDDE